MDENKNAWELNAEWWQNSFTNGANAEYSQQLLPLVVELINEFEKVLEQYELQGIDVSQAQVPNFNLYNCKIKRIKKTGRVKIESIPPEEFLIDRSAKTIEDADFVSHKVLMTRSDLVAMGYPQDEIDELPKSDLDIYNTEQTVRLTDVDDYKISSSTDTSTEKVLPVLNLIDLVLIMSVNPGFGGQKFTQNTLEKVKILRKEIDLKKLKVQIEIDGGINFENAKLAINAGVDILVSGTTIFKENDGNLKKNIQILKTG